MSHTRGESDALNVLVNPFIHIDKPTSDNCTNAEKGFASVQAYPRSRINFIAPWGDCWPVPNLAFKILVISSDAPAGRLGAFCASMEATLSSKSMLSNISSVLSLVLAVVFLIKFDVPRNLAVSIKSTLLPTKL